MMRNKYGARKVKAPDGQVFDSQKEYNRWCNLRLLERAGRITDLRRQISFGLIPAQEGEKACTYVADFVYWENGKFVVEDCKGYRTQAYIIKRKLMLWVHNIKIKET